MPFVKRIVQRSRTRFLSFTPADAEVFRANRTLQCENSSRRDCAQSRENRNQPVSTGRFSHSVLLGDNDVMANGAEGIRRIPRNLLQFGTTGYLATTIAARHGGYYRRRSGGSTRGGDSGPAHRRPLHQSKIQRHRRGRLSLFADQGDRRPCGAFQT